MYTIYDSYTLLVHDWQGLRRLNCPFAVTATRGIRGAILTGRQYWVDEVIADSVERILYRIGQGAYPYYYFEIPGRRESPC